MPVDLENHNEPPDEVVDSAGTSALPPTDALSPDDPGGYVKGTGLWSDAWRRLRKNKLALLGLGVVVFIILAAAAGPMIWKKWRGYTYESIPRERSLVRAMPPSREHPMGTDPQGRDVLARVMVGGQISLVVALVATAVSLFIGVSYGAIAGYVGGRVDNVMMRIVDLLYGVPLIIFVIVMLALFHKSLTLLFATIGAVSWLTMARIVRGQVLSLKNLEFVEAAKSIGVSTPKIIFRHIVPNTLGPVIVYATLTVPTVILQEAFLSFLGLGVQAPWSSWGTLASEGADNIAIYPWMIIFPGMVMALMLFSLNFVGDGLRDALDPHMRKD